MENEDNTKEEATAEAEKSTAKKVVHATGGFFSRLIGAPLKSITGLAKGLWDNTIGNIGGLFMTGATVAASVILAPDLVKWIGSKISFGKDGKNVAQILADDKAHKGMLGVATDAGIAALIINGGWGAAKGAFSGAIDSPGEESSTMAKVGGVIGSGATLAGLAFLAFKAVESNKIGVAGSADVAANQTPAATPKATTTPAGPKF